jgi:hypothetical protein
MTSKRAMARETSWVLAMAMRVEGNKEGNDKEKGEGNEGNGVGNEVGGQARATTWAMVTATRWWVTKRAITLAKREIAMAMMMAGNKEGDGKGGKGNGNGNYNDGQQRGQWQW